MHGLFGGWLGERETNSATILILKIDKCLFKNKEPVPQKNVYWNKVVTKFFSVLANVLALGFDS